MSTERKPRIKAGTRWKVQNVGDFGSCQVHEEGRTYRNGQKVAQMPGLSTEDYDRAEMLSAAPEMRDFIQDLGATFSTEEFGDVPKSIANKAREILNKYEIWCVF